MTDTPNRDTSPLQPDDDRLLAYVLGLEADGELERAAASDEHLRRRLDVLRSELDLVADNVARAVPQPDEHYADASLPRWDGLRPYFRDPDGTAGAPARRSGAGSRWLRILAPTAAVVLAVAVGVVVLQQQNGGIASVSDKSGPELAAPSRSNGGGQVAESAIDETAVRRFAVVLVARARGVRDGLQRFDVVRVLRGAAPAEVTLRVETRPAEEGVLHVLYLSPRDAGAGDASPTSLEPSPVPSGSPLLTASPFVTASPSIDQYGLPLPSAGPAGDELLFSDDGAAALVMALPTGVEAEDISLP